MVRTTHEFRRKLFAGAVLSAVFVAAANVCTWKGSSGGTWSTSANWDTPPVAGRGDTLVFQNGSSGTVLASRNDMAALNLVGLKFLGSNPIAIAGDPIVFGAGSCTVSNTCPVSNAAPLVVNGTLRFRGKGKVVITAAVTGSSGTLVNARADGAQVIDFRAPVQVAAVKSSYGYGEMRFSGEGNSWQTFTLNPLGVFGVGAENVLPRDMVLAFADAYRENRTDLSGLRLNGWDQTIDRISSSTNIYSNARRESDHIRSDYATTLTLRGTADATTWCKVWDKVSLCWNPTGDFMQTFMDRDHATRGRLVVSNGTFRVAGTATFRNVTEIEIAPGARFLLESTFTNALSSLARVTVGAGGTFDVAAAPSPFLKGEVRFSAAPDAVIRLPDGYTTNAVPETDLLRIDFGTSSRFCAVTNATLGASFTGVLPANFGENFCGFSSAVCTSELLEEDGVKFLRFRRNGDTVQFRSSLGLLETPATYRVTTTVRSRPGCQIGLRQDPSPYTTYASATYKSVAWITVTNYFKVEKTLTTTTGVYVYPGAGVTDLKEIRLCRVPASEAEVARPAVDPNRIEFWNGPRRFPFGPPAGWNFNGATEASLAADAENAAPDGVPSLRLAASASTSFYAPPMQTSQGDRPHLFAFRYRASGGWNVSVRAVDNAATLLSAQTLPATTNWCEVAFTIGPRDVDEGFYATFTGSGVLNLDAPSCRLGREGAVPATGPEAILACGPGDAALARIQFTDESAVGRWAAVDAPTNAVLKLRVTDLYGDATFLPDVVLTGGKLQVGTFDYTPPATRPYGQFRVEAWIEQDGANLSPTGETVLTRLPRPVYWGVDGTNSPFGTHLLAQVDQLVAAKAAGVNWTRFHDAGTSYSGWYHLESTKGVWVWPDAEIDRIRSWHIKPFAQLGTAPTWATRFAELDHDPGSYFRRYLRPTNTVDWANYVTRYVTRYKGKVDDYFIWNEPWGGWWKSADDASLYDASTCETAFAELCRTAYLAAKAANPSASISGYNTTHGNTDWGLKLTAAGAFDFCDAIDYHFYTSTTRATSAGETSSSETCLAPIRAVYPDLGGKPVIMSEGQGNSGGSKGVNHRLTGLYRNLIPYQPENESEYRAIADNTARYLLSLLSEGVARAFLYSMHCHSCLGSAATFATLVGEDGFPHPMLVAHAALAQRLEGATFIGRAAFGENGVLFAFRGRENSVVTYFSGLSPADVSALVARPDVAVADLFGNPLTVETWHSDEIVSVTSSRIEAPKESLVYTWTGAAGTGNWDDGGNWHVNGGEATDHGPIAGAAIRFDSSATISAGTVTFGAGTVLTVTNGAAATLKVPISGLGDVFKDGAGTLGLAGSGATFAGTFSVTGGVLRISGNEPLGPCTVKARGVAPVGRVQFAGVETDAAFDLTDGWGGTERTSFTFVSGTTNVVRGKVSGSTCTYFDLPSKSRLVLSGGCKLNYGNMSSYGTLVFTNLPFRSGTMQGSWAGRTEFWATGNKMTSLNGWHASWSPYPMAANVDFRVERAFDDASMLCSFNGVWNLFGTTQRIGSLNSTSSDSRIRSFTGPARLEVNQTGKWRNFASKGSPTGLEDFTFSGAFEGEVSLAMTGSSALVLTGVSTATGSVEVAGGTLVFTNGASWRTATNVVATGTGNIRVQDAQALGTNAVLRLGDSASFSCGRGLVVRELWIDGIPRTAGVYGSIDNTAVPSSHRTARISGSGTLRVVSGPSTLVLIR